MSQNVQVCGIDQDVIDKAKKLRFRKAATNAAIIIKIDREKQLVIMDEELEDCSIEELVAELPPNHPRYVVFSYRLEHSDGRVSFPLCFIYVSPEGCSPEQMMMYAGSKRALEAATNMTKSYDIRDLEELTEEWLLKRLQ